MKVFGKKKKKNWEGFICLLIHSDLNRGAVDHFSDGKTMEEREWQTKWKKESQKNRKTKKDERKKI